MERCKAVKTATVQDMVMYFRCADDLLCGRGERKPTMRLAAKGILQCYTTGKFDTLCSQNCLLHSHEIKYVLQHAYLVLQRLSTWALGPIFDEMSPLDRTTICGSRGGRMVQAVTKKGKTNEASMLCCEGNFAACH